MNAKDLTEQGRIIMEARKREGLTQEQLATQLHVGKMAVSNWELGKNDVDIEMAGQLENILKIQLGDIERKESTQPLMSFCEIKTIEELDNAIECLLNKVPIDYAFASIIKTILRVAAYAVISDKILRKTAERTIQRKSKSQKEQAENLKYAGDFSIKTNESNNRTSDWHDIAIEIVHLIDEENALIFHRGLPEYEELKKEDVSHRAKKGLGTLKVSLGAIDRQIHAYLRQLGPTPVSGEISDIFAYEILMSASWKIYSLQRFHLFPEEESTLGLCVRNAILNLERTSFLIEHKSEDYISVVFKYTLV